VQGSRSRTKEKYTAQEKKIVKKEGPLQGVKKEKKSGVRRNYEALKKRTRKDGYKERKTNERIVLFYHRRRKIRESLSAEWPRRKGKEKTRKGKEGEGRKGAREKKGWGDLRL
jgi:hypothetical protein